MDGGFPALVRDAQMRSQRHVIGAKLVTLEDLILFKAYAGGSKSKLDVAELLVRTRPDFDALNRLAKQYGLLKELKYVLDE